jgi:hypothetical protein
MEWIKDGAVNLIERPHFSASLNVLLFPELGPFALITSLQRSLKRFIILISPVLI